MLYSGMKRLFYVCTFCILLSSIDVQAQLVIPSKPIKAPFGIDQTSKILDDTLNDTTYVGSMDIAEWRSFTNKLGIDDAFGFFVTLPDPGFPYTLLSWTVPYYGGSSVSGQLGNSSVSAQIWLNPTTLAHIHPDSAISNAAAETVEIQPFSYKTVTYAFNGLQAFDGVTSIALGGTYASGPDSAAVSPIYTSDPRLNRYFYSRLEPETDSTTVRVFYEHDAFWNSMDIDPSGFGEMAGMIIVQLDTTTTIDDPDGEDIITSLQEEWYLPGSHKVVDNYPNPFNPQTTIRFMPQVTGEHRIQIYDVLGRVLYDDIRQARAGDVVHIGWNAEMMSSGAYFVSVAAGNRRWLHSMTFSK